MNKNIAIVVTTISKPNRTLLELARQSYSNKYYFVVIGDMNSPTDLNNIEGSDYFSIERQEKTGLKTAELSPYRHYARKNMGYLLAIKKGAERIIETDDDNYPYPNFWENRTRLQAVKTVTKAGWVNIYRYFSESIIWPRGLPLTEVNSETPSFESLPVHKVDCPIQQGLANGNPDVDAIYRLTLPLPQNFKNNRRIALAKYSCSPFNSQNTTWWKVAFPLLYLPAFCSFRMTDIWRSIIAQRIAWENDWAVLFHEPTVLQNRNKHDLMKDFVDEIPGYINNDKIFNELSKIKIKSGQDYLADNLLVCYERLIAMEMLDKKELNLLSAWLNDLKAIN